MEQAGPTAVFLATGVVAEVLISSDAVADHWVHDSAPSRGSPATSLGQS